MNKANSVVTAPFERFSSLTPYANQKCCALAYGEYKKNKSTFPKIDEAGTVVSGETTPSTTNSSRWILFQGWPLWLPNPEST